LVKCISASGLAHVEEMRNTYKGVDWIHLAQDRDHWRAVVNTVMNLRVP